ncbi:MAG: methylaspartate mutase, partial [Planctomycetota bacterium]
PEGVTRIAVDSIFMMPQLGVLSAVDTPAITDSAKRAAVEVFNKDCLIHLGTCIAPVGEGKPGKTCLEVEIDLPGGAPVQRSFAYGDVAVLPFPHGSGKARAVLHPARGFDMGAGPGKEITTEIEGGTAGILVDCRGRRPFKIPEDESERVAWIQRWTAALDAYPALDD